MLTKEIKNEMREREREAMKNVNKSGKELF
jgi:hypothetical protein